jgi:glycosyltransferase involved in cell wall biosynthesis
MSQKNPTFRISIITPVFNAVNYLDSYKKHHLVGRKDVEYILIDDCSTDFTYSKLIENFNKFDNVQILKLTNNVGPGLARLAGIKRARSDYIAFLDIDDTIDVNEKIDIQLQNMLKHNALWSYSQFSKYKKLKASFHYQIYSLKDVLRYRQIAASSVIMQKTLFLYYARGISDFSYSAEDYLLWVRLLKDKIIPYYEPNTVMHYCDDNQGLSSKKRRQLVSVLKLYMLEVGVFKGLKEFVIFLFNKFCHALK